MDRVRFMSSGLGMRQYPVGTTPSADVGDHIMGVVVVAWLTGTAVDRWGERWATSGGMSLRFRAHLTSGFGLELDVDDGHAEAAFELRLDDGTVASSGAFLGPDDSLCPPSVQLGPDHHHRLSATPEALAGAMLAPIEFPFDAARDLAFADGLRDGAFWSDRGWAHPAILASGANALVKERIEFAGPNHWHHAGLELRLHRPVADGSIVRLGGEIVELFDRPRSRFAICAATAVVDDQVVATFRNTFTYAPVEPEHALDIGERGTR